MLPNVAKDTGSVRNFERQSHSPADAYRPGILARPGFLKSSAGRQFVAHEEIGKRVFNRPLILPVKSVVGFSEARQALHSRDTEDHRLAASQIGDKFLYVVERLALGLFKVRVMFDDSPSQVYQGIV